MEIKIKGLKICYPENKVGNEAYVDKFGSDIINLLNHLGRENRYVVGDSSENSLTLAIEASKRCLTESNIKPEEINIIVFVSDTPEYLIPNNAVIVRELIGAVNCDLAYDLNNCCIGMITGIDIVSAYMKLNTEYKTAIVVGASTLSKTAKDDCMIVGPCLGDGSACVILQQSEDEGLVKTVYHANSINHQRMVFPDCGLTNMAKNNIDEQAKKWRWDPHDVSYFSDRWTELIVKLLKETEETFENIDHYLFSQFSHADIKATLKKLNIENWEDKYTFIADKYGYTGNTSPLFAMYEAIKGGKIKPGNTIVFCSVGAGYTMGAMLYRV